MSNRNRTTRTTPVKPKSLLEPFDVSKLGSDEDPCFGKLYDLSAPECRECGDIELCAIKLSQSQAVKTLEMESKMAFRDIQESDLVSAKSYYEELLKKGIQKSVALIRAAKRFNVEKSKLKNAI